MLAERNAYVPASEIRKIFNMIQGQNDVLDMTVGIPDFDTPDFIKKAGKEAIDNGFTRYTHNAGYIETREAMSLKLKRDNGIDANPINEIMMTAGGMGALLLANLVIVNPGDEVLYPDPGFVSHYSHIRLAGGIPIPVPLMKENNFGMSAESVSELITDRTKMIVLNSPNNPTGGVTDPEEMKAIAELANEYDFYILADEAYEQFQYENEKPVFIGSFDEAIERTISIFSLSKTYAMTGWRIGAVAGPKDVIASMVKLQEHVLASPTSIAQKAAEAAVMGPQSCIKDMTATFRKRRDIITKGLNAIEGVELQSPGGAFYAFPDISAFGMSSYDLVIKMLEDIRVAAVHGSAFGQNGEGFIRICYAVSTERIEETIQRMDRYLPSLLRRS
ncbi:MAG: pyridoxal phosphate-dependent aminotransferase [Candidatus Thorarchaeota archaeon]